MSRSSRRACCEKVGLRKGPWRPEEDKKLIAHVEQHGYGNWRSLPARAGLRRCGKSCRLRWINYLKPDIKRGNFSMEEDRTIIHLHALLGNKWSVIAAHLPKRTDNEIKNYWNSHIKKRLIRMGIDPNTHTPMKAIKASNNNNNNNVRHMAQWESARLEAEARSSSMLMQQQQQQQIIGTASAGSSYSSNSSLIISRIPTKNNNMCAIVLIANSSSTTNDDLQSPVSTLSSPGIREHFTGELLTSLSSYQGTTSTDDHSNSNIFNNNNNNNIIEESGGHVSNLLQDDDELMVAVEAFRSAARCESAMEGRL